MKKSVFQQAPEVIFEIQEGIERESLRANLKAQAALTKHPETLGSKLTHSSITTDYSENLLEFITGVHTHTSDLLQELNVIHAFTQKQLDKEVLWPNSMPPLLPAEEKIPLADYGTSNVGKLKTLYRKGLGHRYGRSMQSIAGVHYNFSLTDRFWKYEKDVLKITTPLKAYKNERYFHLIRNFQRYRWLLVYLFGSSPVVDESFLLGKKHNLERLTDHSFFSPLGTSLRMGGLGYTSSAQASIGICYNQVETYIKTLEAARLTPYQAYKKIGYKKNNELLQLNTNLLQIDNEFYSTIRPKNIARSKESALLALHRRGIEYVEVRLLDVDPFESVGIAKDSILFLHVFLLWCLSKEAPRIRKEECDEIDFNLNQVVQFGRASETFLTKQGRKKELTEWAKEILSEMNEFSTEFFKLDSAYAMALDVQQRKLETKDNLPSQKLINALGTDSFLNFHKRLAVDYSHKYQLTPSDEERFKQFAQLSWDKQKEIENHDQLSFESFLKKYFEEIRIDYQEVLEE